MSNELKETQEKKKTFSYDIGAYRQNKDGHKDQGDDGILIDHRVVAVADGVGTWEGKGQLVLRDFQTLLRRNDRDLKDSFVELSMICFQLRNSMMSTLVAMKFPRRLGKKAQFISVGDSSLFRIRKGAVKQMNVHHTIARQLVSRFPEYETLERRIALLGIGKDLEEAEIHEWCRRIKKLFPNFITQTISKCLRLPYQSLKEKAEKCRVFLSILQRCEKTLLHALGDEPENTLHSVEEEEPSVHMGDVWVLCTDGINSVRKHLHEIFVRSADEAAKFLVENSTIRDDRAAVVVKVQRNESPRS